VRRSAAARLGLPVVNEPDAFGQGGGLYPAGHAQLAQDAGHVHAGRLGADEQLRADLGIGQPGREQPEHDQLAVGQPVPGRGRARCRPTDGAERDPGTPSQLADLGQQRRVTFGRLGGGP